MPQAQLVQRLVAARELSLAVDFSTQYGLELDLGQLLDPDSIDQIQAEEAARYLPLPLPPSAILVVDTLELVIQAHASLQQACIVGIDAEWKPGRDPGSVHEISLLQVRTFCSVYAHDARSWGDWREMRLSTAGPEHHKLSATLLVMLAHKHSLCRLCDCAKLLQ